MPRAVQALAFLALVIACASAQSDAPLDTQFAKDRPLFAKLVARLKLRADAAKTFGTFFVPNDRAITTWLKDMGLTADDVMARPQLVDALLSYHFVPGVAIRNFAAKDKDSDKSLISTDPSKPTYLRTGDIANNIRIFRSPATNRVQLIDAQGNRVAVLGKPIVYGKMVFWEVSNVLMSGMYFYNTRAAVRFYAQWSTFQELYQRGANSQSPFADALTGSDPLTLLVPNNAALNPVAQAVLKASSTDLASILAYHVVPGLKPVPDGWKDGETVQTLLKGNTIKATVGTRDYISQWDGSTKQGPALTLTPEVGKPAQVTVYNVFAGKSIMQGINALLLPNTATGKALAAAVPDAKVSSEKAPATAMPAAATTAAAPKATSEKAPASAAPAATTAAAPKATSEKAPATAAPAAATAAAPKPTTEKAPAGSTPAAPAAAAAPKPTGRHLLQGVSGGGSRSFSTGLSMAGSLNTQDAIRAAASGTTPTSYATSAGLRNAEAVAADCFNCVGWGREI